MRYALHLTHDKVRAEELAADAVAAALDPDRSPWNRNSRKPLSLHVYNIVRMRIKDEAAKAKVRNDPRNAGAVTDGLRRAVPRPDARLTVDERHERGETRWQEVREGLAFEQRVLDMFGEGLTAAEQAMRTRVGGRLSARRRRRG